ncbi:hypothetical protein [Aliarcobacter butzleri]|uniref:hypothetical protein n=1 Tax=Aliarcobacter butzleri TaxID=28197 RepID=UPI00215A15F3|nr:hypothetical protein [Aliarcobacter butzleri]MCR8711310.1 hypothetical protein [Aliarcobacter butzleri]
MIPIYRAKKIDSGEYVEGYYFHQEWTGDYPSEDSEEREEKIRHFITGFTTHDIWDDEEGHFKFMGIDEIDPTTLAINFPDMLDNEGNKIFASLSEDGKGGDIYEVKQPYRKTQTHKGDNIPLGSYTESLELEIKTIKSTVIYKNGIISLLDDIDEDFTYPLMQRLKSNKTLEIEELLSNGYGVSKEDIEYIIETYNIESEDKILKYMKPKAIGIQE